jgi:predicted ATP-binding protein involved in virulence
MIDEIDMHLHPKWQGMVVPKLLEVFPNCQFLISTHSPHVLTRVQPENIRLMEIDGEEMRAHKVTESYGKTANRILEDLMGLESTRPAEIEERLDELYEMIETGKFKEALNEINDLRTTIGSDPELTKAAVLIKRKEVLGK